VRSSIAVRVTRATGAVNAGAARVQAYGSEIIPRFEENLALLSRAFELGEIDVLQALLARERFLQLERDSLAAFADYYQAVAELEAELGQELWPDDRHDHEAPR
jgi:cobalt-zinc-cadmium efflux system outer membrane protein